MRIGFIIAEYNPLHNGHVKLINAAKQEADCDKIVCIMSGDMVQRGELAIKDKYSRASWAIQAGCDMVVELPPEFAVSSAQTFATGAIKAISLFDCEKTLAFGSEIGDINSLNKIVNTILNSDYQQALKKYLSQGFSYAKSSHLALLDYIDEDLANCLLYPNNTLAIEYLKAIDDSITPFTIKRDGSYNESIDEENPSAKSIRELLSNEGSINQLVPSYVYDELYDVEDISKKLFSIIKYELPKVENLDKILGMQEGLGNRILSNLNTCATYKELLDAVKTKRYTYPTITRAILSALIKHYDSVDSLIDQEISHLNILAIKATEKELLSLIKAPIVTKPHDEKKLELDTSLYKNEFNLFIALKYNYEPYMRII